MRKTIKSMTAAATTDRMARLKGYAEQAQKIGSEGVLEQIAVRSSRGGYRVVVKDFSQKRE